MPGTINDNNYNNKVTVCEYVCMHTFIGVVEWIAFGRSWAQMAACRPAVQTEVTCGFDPGNPVTVPHYRPLLLPSAFFPVHYSSVILLFDIIHSLSY